MCHVHLLCGCVAFYVVPQEGELTDTFQKRMSTLLQGPQK
jgi:hypothetical protein